MWPTENPWPMAALSFTVAAWFTFIYAQRRQGRYLIGMLLGVLGIIAAWVIDRAIITSREQVEQSVYGVTSAFQQRDLPETITYISPQALDLRFLIGTAYNLVKVGDDMRVTDVNVEMLNENTRAKSTFRVNATFSFQTGSAREPTRWLATWQLEGDKWQMIDILELDPITGARLSRIDPYREMVRRIYPVN